MVILAESKSCETLLRSWRRRQLQAHLLAGSVPLLLLALLFLLGDTVHFVVFTACCFILTGLSAALILSAFVRTQKALTPEVNKFLELCRTESLSISEGLVFGSCASGPFRFSLREVRSVRVIPPVKRNRYASARFPNDVLVLECVQQTYRFSSFANCRQLLTVLRLLTRY